MCSLVNKIEGINLQQTTRKGGFIGEVVKSYEIGFEGNRYYTWVACVDCGEERWVAIVKGGAPRYKFCRSCSHRGARSVLWKGGRIKHQRDYIEVRVYPDDFFYPLANKAGYAMEHRLVMAKHINRCLYPWEVVHHRDGNKQNNELSNLELLPSRGSHLIDCVLKSKLGRQEKRIKWLEQRVTILEAENALAGINKCVI